MSVCVFVCIRNNTQLTIWNVNGTELLWTKAPNDNSWISWGKAGQMKYNLQPASGKMKINAKNMEIKMKEHSFGMYIQIFTLLFRFETNIYSITTRCSQVALANWDVCTSNHVKCRCACCIPWKLFNCFAIVYFSWKPKVFECWVSEWVCVRAVRVFIFENCITVNFLLYHRALKWITNGKSVS